MSNVTRPSSSNNYDEQFVVPLEASRRGAHRARVSPVMAAMPVVVVVGVVGGAILLVSSLFGGGPEAGAGATVSASPSTSSAASEPGSSPSESTAEAGGDSTASSEPDETSAAPGKVDKSVTIDVFNGTSPLVTGIARKALPKITEAGWRTGRVATWSGTPVSVTTVFYAESGQQATASAIAKALGRASVKISPKAAKAAEGGIAVVVGNDFPGAGSRSTKSQSGATRRSTARTTSEARTTAEPRDTATPAEPSPEGENAPVSPSPTD
ncbi:MAG: LytR C-terminal protein [Actinomycetota bacterium]|nr:LytR C-terminal protein [Actinomycetota bacterium]